MRRLERVAEHEWCFRWPEAFRDEHEAIEEAVDRFEAGRRRAAERALRAVLDRVPEHLDATWQLGVFLREQGKRAEAEELLEEAVRLGHTAFPRAPFSWAATAWNGAGSRTGRFCAVSRP